MKKFGLLGKSIQYSLSPHIHNIFLSAFEIDGNYELIDLDETQFEQFVAETLMKYDGLNITIPYKTAIYELIQQNQTYHTNWNDDARKVSAVNCIHIQNPEITFYNTDFTGFLYPLKNIDLNQTGTFVVLGNGGASKAVIYGLKNAYPYAKVIVAARNPKENQIHIDDINVNQKYDLIVNTTPTVPIQFLNLDQQTIIYDLSYVPDKLAMFKAHPDAKHIDGLAMLVVQAAKSFEYWNNVYIDDLLIEQTIQKMRGYIYETHK